MFEVNINVNPQSCADMQRALEFILNQPCMIKFKEQYSNGASCPTGIQVGSNANLQKIQELEKEIQMHQKENEKNQKLLSDKDDEIEKIQQLVQKQTKNSKELEDELLKALDAKEKIEEESKSQLETLRKEYSKSLNKKDEEISRLKKKLESYSISFGSDDPSEKIYFEVSENGTLEESTISSDSLYYASKSGDIYKYTINTDNGPTSEAVKDINRYLTPYCNIKVKMEGANTIQIVSVGKAKLMVGAVEVIEKAVISLIKQ